MRCPVGGAWFLTARYPQDAVVFESLETKHWQYWSVRKRQLQAGPLLDDLPTRARASALSCGPLWALGGSEVQRFSPVRRLCALRRKLTMSFTT